ncbi:MAG: DUF1097 family protein [Clostridiales bacterium]|jgi:hypothetical protein|nr:DUF1097 family protein [Clostridiales bacterium]
MGKFKVVLALAILIALIAPAWAVLGTFAFGFLVAPAALISAGIYVADGAQVKHSPKIALGFVAGNFWAYFVVKALGVFGMGPLQLFLVLVVFVLVAVFLAMYFDKVFDLSAWLTAWAGTLVVLTLPGMPLSPEQALLQMGVSYVAGVFVVGLPILYLHGLCVKKLQGGKKP